jgi:SAM-dependent methyltransferase
MSRASGEERWSKYRGTGGFAFPAEYVIRIFKGSYPRLNLDKAAYRGKRILDMGCGDGRNLVLLSQCGLELYGVEVSELMIAEARTNLDAVGIAADIRLGWNDSIPFPDEFFNYLLAWNVIYYLRGEKADFGAHVREASRVLKQDGYLILSIPMKSCFIFKDCKHLGNGYVVITNDPWKSRIGDVFRMFDNEREIQDAFSGHFKDFAFGSVQDDCFGYEYHWHLVVCRKK